MTLSNGAFRSPAGRICSNWTQLSPPAALLRKRLKRAVPYCSTKLIDQQPLQHWLLGNFVAHRHRHMNTSSPAARFRDFFYPDC